MRIRNIGFKEYPLTGNMLIKEIAIDVTGVQILKIIFSLKGTISYSSGQFGFGNITIE